MADVRPFRRGPQREVDEETQDREREEELARLAARHYPKDDRWRFIVRISDEPRRRD